MSTNHRMSPGHAVLLLLSVLFAACQDADPAGPASPLAVQEARSGVACLMKKTLSERLAFASADRAGKILGHPDEWARQLSDFEMGARQRTLEPTSRQEFLAFASSTGLGWTAAEQAAWLAVADRLSVAVEGLNLKIPQIFLVKTSGDEEFDAAYTRGRSIMLPQRLVGLTQSDPRRAFFLLAHELFHVLSRENQAQRDALYALLGFERFRGFTYPAELEGRRLSNPDAYSYEHALEVQTPSGGVSVVPVVQTTVPLEAVILLPTIFSVLDIVLLAVDTERGDVLRDGSGNLLAYHFGNTNWVPQMLRNSSYIIHPEELLADNFATLMEWRADGVLPAANPGGFPVNDLDLLKHMQAVLTQGCG